MGIETSCDETSVAIVQDGRRVLSNNTASSLRLHQKYGGVIPEIAFRAQLETISQVCRSALKDAAVRPQDLKLICVTCGPGLAGSLLVGVSFAKALSFSLGLPLLEVDHLHGHIYSGLLNRVPVKNPYVALVVSGGHTSLFFVRDYKRIDLLGSTLDDACGEAFDKVAKILGLGYPGGPLIEKLAQKGNPKRIKFSCSGTKSPLDFSFSGIKTAVLYYYSKLRAPSSELKSDIAASFQEAVINTLVHKSFLACRLKKTNCLVIGGGVVANSRLREKFQQQGERENIALYFPEKRFCTDNAAMVAGLGYRLLKTGRADG